MGSLRQVSGIPVSAQESRGCAWASSNMLCVMMASLAWYRGCLKVGQWGRSAGRLAFQSRRGSCRSLLGSVPTCFCVIVAFLVWYHGCLPARLSHDGNCFCGPSHTSQPATAGVPQELAVRQASVHCASLSCAHRCKRRSCKAVFRAVKRRDRHDPTDVRLRGGLMF